MSPNILAPYLGPAMQRDLPRFYMPDLANAKEQTLSGDEAAHAGRVLRMKAGDELIIIDGRGRGVIAEAVRVSKRDLDFEVKEELSSEIPASGFHLAIAPTKQVDRIEWCLEKCTEIGLKRFTPILCHHSERKNLRTDRLLKRAISAMKQSKSLFLPEIDEPVTFKEFLALDHGDALRTIAHCRDGEKLSLRQPDQNVIVLIGPEGDFSQEEVQQAIDLGWSGIHLGVKRLRTETAAVVACTISQL